MDPDVETYIKCLRSSDLLRGTMIRAAVKSLRLPAGSRGVDVACGIGSHTLLLAEAVGTGGHVTGIDISTPFLEAARKRVRELGLADSVDFIEADLSAIPCGDGHFDWLWCADCTTPIAENPASSIGEFMRVVKPGGTIAILIWSSQQILPGYPELEAKLNATSKGVAPYRAGQPPGQHHMRALAWLRSAGLKDCRADTFVQTVHGPLGDDLKESLALLFEMRWGGLGDEIPEQDRAEFKRLCGPDSPEFIANDPDYYAFFTYSMFSGRVSG